MSMFRSIMRDFDHDQFFSGQLDSVRRMETMMEGMMAPFGGMMGIGFPRLPSIQPPEMSPFGNSLMPFGFGRSLFPNMNQMFSSMMPPHQAMVQQQQPPMHSYSSSSVMTYTTDEMGRPQVYQATSSTRTAPGGVKETRNSVQDTRSGVQKMAVGHHLGERAHIVEKARNRFTGEQNENQEFINLDEDEAEEFNNEWQDKTQTFNRRDNSIQSITQGNQRTEPLAITGGPTIVEITDSSELENEIVEADNEPIIEAPCSSSNKAAPKNVSFSSAVGATRKRDSPDLSVIGHSHREGKHKRRHHAYAGGSKMGHRNDKKNKQKHETNM